MATTLALIINFAGLVLSVWLGIYIVSHNRRSGMGWLSGLTLWAVAGVFANLMLYLYSSSAPTGQPVWLRLIFPVWPQEDASPGFIGWTHGWAIILAIVFWYHLSVLAIPGLIAAWRKVSLVLCYGLGILAPILQANTPYVFQVSHAYALMTDTLQYGILFPVFALALFVFPSLTVFNLFKAKRVSDSVIIQRQLNPLIAASLTACLAVVLMLVGTMRSFSFPTIWLSLLLLLSVSFFCYGVTRYSALLEQRILRRDLAYSAVSIGLVVILYLSLFWWLNVSYNTPAGIVVFLIPLVILTHSATDGVRRVLERFIYDQRTRQLRSKLREMNRLAGEQADLGELLSISLLTISASVRATKAVVLAFDEDLAYPTGAFRWHDSKISFPVPDFLADEEKHLKPGSLPDPFSEATLLIPLYAGEKQIGALLLGRPENGIHYSSEDLLILQEPCEQIEDLIISNKRITSYLEQFTKMRLKKSDLPKELIPIQWVEDALQNVYDFAYLGDSPLANLNQVQSLLPDPSATHIDRGKAVYQVISCAVEKLCPGGSPPHEPVPREWFPYLILHEAYFEGLLNRDILLKLYISEGTFHRTRRSALRSVARVLSEQEAS